MDHNLYGSYGSGKLVNNNNSMLCRYDAYKKAQSARLAEQGIPLPSGWYRLSYFHCSLFGYFLGLLTATITSEVEYKEHISNRRQLKI
jgi:hypothetical protein